MKCNNLPDIPFCFNLRWDLYDKLYQTSLICQGTHLEFPIPHQTIYIYIIYIYIYIYIYMQDSLGIKPDWFVGIRWFVLKKSNMLFYNRHSNIFPHIGRSEIGRVCNFLMNWNNICFFLFQWQKANCDS